MADFLTTQGTSFHIENIIKNAKSKLVLITPYLKLSKTLFTRIKDTDRRDVKITLVYGKDALKSDERNQLKQLNNLSLYFCENLHAKCYFNEECMVITSMNMYEFSEKNNREMGILIQKKDDAKVFNEAVKEAISIRDASTKDDLKKFEEVSYHPQTKQKAYCIRCRLPIPYNIERPFCRDCFLEWSEWENPFYDESFCHTCGKTELTSMGMPQCDSCYIESRRQR